jgi:hypothetical protein
MSKLVSFFSSISSLLDASGDSYFEFLARNPTKKVKYEPRIEGPFLVYDDWERVGDHIRSAMRQIDNEIAHK